LQARVLLLDQPFNGLYSESCGVTARARGQYYAKVRSLAGRYGMSLSDFSAYEDDRSFFRDEVHPSALAWIYYDQALDGFYRAGHG